MVNVSKLAVKLQDLRLLVTPGLQCVSKHTDGKRWARELVYLMYMDQCANVSFRRNAHFKTFT